MKLNLSVEVDQDIIYCSIFPAVLRYEEENGLSEGGAMASIFGLIAQYREELTVLPTMIIIFVLITLLCYILFNQYKWVKYIPALIGILVGVFFFLTGINNAVEPGGLDVIWKGIYFFVAGCIALGTAWIIALLSSMATPQKSKPAVKKKKKQPARQPESGRSFNRSGEPESVIEAGDYGAFHQAAMQGPAGSRSEAGAVSDQTRAFPRPELGREAMNEGVVPNPAAETGEIPVIQPGKNEGEISSLDLDNLTFAPLPRDELSGYKPKKAIIQNPSDRARE